MAKKQAKNLVAARKAKRTKQFNYKVGVAKRTKVGQSLKKAGVSFEVSGPSHVEFPIQLGTSQMTVERTISPARAKIEKRLSKRKAKRLIGKGIKSKAFSPRHEAQLIAPDRPFAEAIGAKARIAAGLGLGSTAIVSFEYIPERNVLILHWWKDWKRGIPGVKYAYFNVPWEEYQNLLNASSKGRYIYYNIRMNYRFQRLG